jgi:hypothetical protein
MGYIFFALEPFGAFRPLRDKMAHVNFYRSDIGKCIHICFHFIAPDFGCECCA